MGSSFASLLCSKINPFPLSLTKLRPMSPAILFLRRIPHLRPSLPLTNRTSSFYRLLSTAATTQSIPPNPHFAVVDFLIQSCGLPSDKAIQAFKRIQHLKSPDKPDAVVRFLRQISISESDIRTAVSREPRLLVSGVEKNWRPNVAKLQEIGLSIEDISGIISRSPGLFRFNILPKIDFWMQALGSFENISVLLKKGPRLINYSLEKVIVPNLAFLQKQCGLSVRQIVQLIKSAPRLISSKPETIKIKVKSVEELGVSCSSRMFVFALVTVANVNKSTLNSRISYLKSMGLSQEDVARVIGKAPTVLRLSEELLGRKIELLKSMGLSQEDVAHVIGKAPTVLQLSEELLCRKIELLKSMGLSQEDVAHVTGQAPSVLQLSEELLGRKIELLKSMGLSQEDVARVIGKAPNVLQLSEELLCRKIELLKSMGLSQEDVPRVIGKAPSVLQLSEELLGRKIEFLMNEAGCGKIDVVRNPVLLSLSLEKRLIPRNLVRKLLKSKEFPVENLSFATFAKPSDEKFVKKFVLPYEHAIPGLGQAYANACARNIELLSSSGVLKLTIL